MNPETQYRYVEMGRYLLDEMHLHVQRGESFVLLGCEGGGKRHALTLLGKRLDAEERAHISVFFKDGLQLVTEKELLKALKKRVRHKGCDAIVNELADAATLADWFNRLNQMSSAPGVAISFANVDRLADHIKQEFLAHVRNSVQRNHLVVALTGDTVLARTLASEGSPFQCTYNYVLVGHSEAICREFFRKRVRTCQLKFEDPNDPAWNNEEAFAALFKLAGGNINLIRIVLWCLSERRMRFDDNAEKHPGYPRNIIEKSFFDYTSVPLFGLKPFHGAKSILEHNRDVLNRLEQLLDAVQSYCECGAKLPDAFEAASIPVTQKVPEPLELLGFVRRDVSSKQIKFSSPYVADFAWNYFSWTCRGDFHAKQGDWTKAFACYKNVDCPERRRRPLGELDYLILRVIVNRLCREFAESIPKQGNIGKLRELLDQAARLLFGLKGARVIRINEDGSWSYSDAGPLSADLNEIVQRICESPPIPNMREGVNYDVRADGARRVMVVQARKARGSTNDLSPHHALLIESENEGLALEGLRLRLLETVSANFLTCFGEARLRQRSLKSRLRLGEALKQLLGKDSVQQIIEALGQYLQNEFDARAVRLFYVDASGNLKSAKSWGFKDATLRQQFDAGELILIKGEEHQMWAALDEKTPVAFRYCPSGVQLLPCTTDFQFRETAANKNAVRVERQPGDYWIDFPLFVGEIPYGKLTFTFPSNAPPQERYMDDLSVISEILSYHLKSLKQSETRLQEVRSIQQRAIAVTAHDLATRISSLPIFLAEYRALEKSLPNEYQQLIKDTNERFKTRLQASMDILERAKLRLAEVKLVYSQFDLVEVIREALRSIDPAKGAGDIKLEGAVEQAAIVIEADIANLSGVFLELVSDSVTMHNGHGALSVQINLYAIPEKNRLLIDYRDNGPGVPDGLKEKIFEYLVSYRPGQKRQGLGLGLGYVRETIQAHRGTIKEEGRFGEGVHFHIELPIKPQNL